MTDATIWTSGSEQVPGPKGDPGPPGPVNTLTIGTVTQGITPAATITGAAPNQTLNLQLPQGSPGNQGLPGPANTLTIGTVNSASAAAASITGTAPNQVLNLTFPIQQFSPAYGAAFGFADGYLAGTDITAGVDLVWTTIKMDPAGVFPAQNSNLIIIPAALNGKWFDVRVNITQPDSLAAESATSTPVTSQKIVLIHDRGGVLTKWRVTGTGGYTVGAKEVTSGPIQLQTGDTLKVRIYSTSSSSGGLGVNSYIYLNPLGINVPT